MAYRDGFYDRSGDRKHPIKIYSRPTTRGPAGEIDVSFKSMPDWPVFLELAWASVNITSGIDLMRSDREVNKVWATFTIPYSPSTQPTAAMGLRWQNRYFDIQNVSNVEGEGQTVEILAQEVE